ncbi:MAG: T9SS type A sorting domain-containing protein [Bacteroidota bacterium]
MKYFFSLIISLISVNYSFSQNVFHVDDSNLSGTEDGSSSKPFNSIIEAVNFAISGDTIKVATGSYSPISISEKKIHLLGGFLGGSIANYDATISGDFNSRDFESNLTTIQGDGTQSCIYFSIEQQEISGNATISGFEIKGGERGITLFGEYSGFLSNVIIEDNHFQSNGTMNTGQLGGAIGFEGINIIIRRNLFNNNFAGRGGAISRTAGSPENFLITENVIDNNQGVDDHAGAVYLNGSGTFSFNKVRNNSAAIGFNYGWGGGLMLFNYDTTKLMVVANNIFYNNVAPSRGGAIFVDEAAKVLIDHNLIYGNSNLNAEGGAAIYVDSDFDNNPSVVEIRSCTIANNTPGLAEGGALYVQASIVKVENCIFWGNSADDFHLSQDGQNAASLEVNYTLSTENFSGTGNISSDPLFVVAQGHDFHLQSTFGHYFDSEDFIFDNQNSPAIDAGNPNSDFSNEPQENGNRINLGVYGNTAEASKSGGINLIENLVKDENNFSIYPNPAKNEITISDLKQKSTYFLSNPEGKVVQLGKTEEKINISNLSCGIYFIEIEGKTEKIIIE